MRIVPFEPRHLARIEAGPFERLAVEGLDFDWPASGAPIPGPAFTLIDLDGTPLGAGGLVPLWRGVAQGWIFASDRLRRHPVTLHRTVQHGLALAEAGLALHRIQITVHEDFAASRRWVERLGFRFEGRMPGYGPNRDTYLRYARTSP
jgi:hypothetical protein